MLPNSARDRLENPTPFPVLLEQQWAWFRELSATARNPAASHPSMISSLEIMAWCHLRRIVLEPWELRLIRLLDIAWLEAVSKKDARQ